MRFDEISDELREKARKCGSYEEKMALIKENEIELTDEQLDLVNGGSTGPHQGRPDCPKCDNGYLRKTGRERPGEILGIFNDVERRCNICGYTDWFWW